MIDDGIGFHLVPWQPVLDKRIGRHITGTVRDAGGIEWSFGSWRYECPQCGYLVVAMGPDRRHPLKAGASRATASLLTALTGCRRPGKGSPSG